MTTRLIEGDGTKKHPYIVRDLGGVRVETTSIKNICQLADKAQVTRLSVAYSGRYFERRADGWWETSDSETCDRIHGLPPEGRVILEVANV